MDVDTIIWTEANARLELSHTLGIMTPASHYYCTQGIIVTYVYKGVCLGKSFVSDIGKQKWTIVQLSINMQDSALATLCIRKLSHYSFQAVGPKDVDISPWKSEANILTQPFPILSELAFEIGLYLQSMPHFEKIKYPKF